MSSGSVPHEKANRRPRLLGLIVPTALIPPAVLLDLQIQAPLCTGALSFFAAIVVVLKITGRKGGKPFGRDVWTVGALLLLFSWPALRVTAAASNRSAINRAMELRSIVLGASDKAAAYEAYRSFCGGRVGMACSDFGNAILYSPVSSEIIVFQYPNRRSSIDVRTGAISAPDREY